MRPQQPPQAVIDLAEGVAKRAAAAILLAAGLGLLAIWAGLSGRVTGGQGAGIAVAVVGGVLVLIGLTGALLWRVITRPRSLVIDQAGLRWHDPRGNPWQVAWPELAGVALSRTVNRNPTKVAPSAMVRLDLFPADPGFRRRHPEMEPLWEFHRVHAGYRVPFGEVLDRDGLVPRLDHALRTFAGPRYRGVRDEGCTVGLT
ncbi:hypothetical protein [Nocardia farcinica]|uniref:hypothetical protein n=1 Tax=Nocardia farcinica TaxID=37329 RepID=UPI002456EE8E|nr:hypothetical protein [Nocardia farcinica]